MKLAAHQPGYLPPISIFQKMMRSDVFLIVDDLQYTRTANLNRTQIKNINGALWLTVPVLSKHKAYQNIKCVQIDNHENWRHKHLRTLEINYQNAPYFYRYIDVLSEIYRKQWRNLLGLNLSLLEMIKKELILHHTQVIKSSEMPFMKNMNTRLIAIMEKLGCDTYIVEDFYRDFVDVSLFRKSKFTVEFIQPEPANYYQQFDDFIPNLSIIDLLFNEGEMSREKLLIG